MPVIDYECNQENLFLLKQQIVVDEQKEIEVSASALMALANESEATTHLFPQTPKTPTSPLRHLSSPPMSPIQVSKTLPHGHSINPFDLSQSFAPFKDDPDFFSMRD